MITITWSDVVDVAAELATGVSAGAQAKILARVEAQVNPAAFGGEDHPTYVLAKCYLAAHHGKLAKLAAAGGVVGAGAGPITSMSEGGVSVSFGSSSSGGSSGGAGGLGNTPYGQQFRDLVAQSGVANAGFVTGET